VWQGSRDPGVTRYAPVLRQQQREDLFVPDQGSIHSSEKFVYYVPCRLAHPGLCAERHAVLLPVAKTCAAALLKVCVQDALCGEYIRLRCEVGNWSCVAWSVMSHTRGSGPKLLMLAPCSFDPVGKCLSISMVGNMLDFMHAVSFFGLLLRGAPQTELQHLQVRLRSWHLPPGLACPDTFGFFRKTDFQVNPFDCFAHKREFQIFRIEIDLSGQANRNLNLALICLRSVCFGVASTASQGQVSGRLCQLPR